MFTLEDGREHLYQWDLNRRILVNDPKICEVHFCNRTSDCSLVVEVYTDDTYDGKTYADIPNILLQDARPIRAYAYCDDQYTLTEQQFTVKSRTKPDDYVYTETETLQYSTLDARITELETNIEDVVAEEVNKYVEENPIEVDLSDYYTKAQTDSAIGEAVNSIEIPEPDLSPYAKVADIPTKVSQLENDKGYLTEHQSLDGLATEKYVDDAIAAIDIPEADVDLSNYYTKEETDTAISGKADKQHSHDLSHIIDFHNWELGFIADLEEEYYNKTETHKAINDAIQTALSGIAIAEEGSY